jgi:hypothetical protein
MRLNWLIKKGTFPKKHMPKAYGTTAFIMQTKNPTNNVQTLFVGLSLVPLTGLELQKTKFNLYHKSV